MDHFLWGGEYKPWERLVEGVEPPHGPPYNTLGGSFLVSFTGKFAGNLEWIACKLISLFVIFFHVSYSNMHVMFFEIRPIEESQDPSNSPRREEVGRRTLGDHGGFLLPFFLSG